MWGRELYIRKIKTSNINKFKIRILKRFSRFFLDVINVIKLLTGDTAFPWVQLSCSHNWVWLCVSCSMDEQRCFEFFLHLRSSFLRTGLSSGPTSASLTAPAHIPQIFFSYLMCQWLLAESMLSTSTVNARNHVPPETIWKCEDLMNSACLQGFEFLMHHMWWHNEF